MSAEETVYQHIEKAILEHRLPPGTRLRELKLADIFGVKRGLIRKVLTRLSNAKLIEHKPHIGAQVACPSVEDAEDLFYTRYALESAVIDLLCQQNPASFIEALKRHCRLEQNAYAENDHQQGVRLSANFHRELAKHAGNALLEDFLNTIINRTPFVVMPDAQAADTSTCLNHDHMDIVIAIENQDGKLAKKLMKQHLEHMKNLFHSKHKPNENSLEQAFNI